MFQQTFAQRVQNHFIIRTEIGAVALVDLTNDLGERVWLLVYNSRATGAFAYRINNALFAFELYAYFKLFGNLVSVHVYRLKHLIWQRVFYFRQLPRKKFQKNKQSLKVCILKRHDL